MISERDELLIQRCVDDELSPEQTRALTVRLDTLTGGWKSLACGFLEDRCLRKSIETGRGAAGLAEAEPSVMATVVTDPVVVSPVVRGIRKPLERVWRHPATSLALCAAIAFLGGLLVPNGRPIDDSGSVPGGEFVAAGGPSRRGSGQMEVQMPGQRPVSVPIFDSREEWVRQSNPKVLAPNAGTQYIIVPTEDGRVVVVPVSRVASDGLQ